ncbi:phage tail protein [Pedobacter jejuensis]|uniref:Tail spike domain-containing protein n=1 Tax=Pedobacter jejuensis TaxID=1268550 RepID=A0A3N0BQ50_9SPHI|nr:hypothetical protein [Pedobacter jejuensis]RNL50763.1 hypothetical protein D7004_17905 [Pedobacter jejuensis]
MNNTLDIYRQGSVIATIDIDENTVFNGKLPGTELISCPITSVQILNLQEEDYIIHRGAAYKIRILPDIDKDSESLASSYRINFLARFYDLLDTYVQHLGAKRFSYYGSASDHLQVLIDSANLNDNGWTIGTVDATAELNLDYDWTFIRPALDQIAQAFGLEWNANGTTINMVATVGNDTGLVFEVGRGKGLHQISRSSDTSKEKINRVYGIGGTRNIDSTYRGGTEPNLVFEERYVETAGVTNGTERVREGKYENLELFPKFEGVVNGVSFVADNTGKITSATIQDPNINFDLMANLQEGVKPKVSFLTGPVTGIDFEISGFDLATKSIMLIPFTDTTGYYFPSATSKPELGDKFTLIDLRMPSAYQATWEAKLKAETLKFLNENDKQRLLFAVKPDEKHLRDNNILLNCGDRGTVLDDDFSVNEILRFTEISYPLVNEFDVNGVIGNEIVFDQSVKQYAAVLNNIKQIAQITAKGIIQSKRSAQALRQLEGSIFDTDGMFDSSKLNVGVLTAVLGIFGVRSQNFVLSNVRMVDNVGGNANAISISGGQLIHLELSNAGTGGDTWTMTELNQSGLTPTNLYYIYAKCSKTSQVGSWIVSTAQIKPDYVPGFYHFLAGVIYPVNAGFRDTEFTYGITDITGNRIKTGTIAGRNGALEINLETGTIKGDITFVGSSLSNINNIQSTANLGVTNAQNAQNSANSANSVAVNAANAASTAQASANTANNILANIANDNILAASEKPDVLKEYNIIVSEKPIIIIQAGQYVISATAYDNNYAALINYLNPLLSAMGSDDAINGATFRQYFTNYYTEKVSLLSAIALKAKQLADAAQASANTAINNAQAVQNNLSALQNGLGGLAYANAIQLAQLGDTIIQGGYIKSVLLDVNAIVVTGGLATQSFAQNVAANAGSNALTNATNLVNSLQIGGVNQFKKTTPLGGGSLIAYHINDSNNPENLFVSNGLWAVGRPDGTAVTIRLLYVISEPGLYTVSGWMRSNGSPNVSIDISDINGYNTALVNNVWTRFEATINVTNYDAVIYNFLDFTFNQYAYFYVKDLKIEKGNKATAWSPSPDDVANNAATLAQIAQNAATNYATSQSAYEREIAKSYADGKVTAEEVARITQAAANLADAKADSQTKFINAVNNANGYTEGRINDVVQYANGYTEGRINDVVQYADSVATTKANAAQTAAIASASSYAQSVANTAQSNAQTAAQNLVADLSIGAQNLLNDGNFERGTTTLGSGFGYIGAPGFISGLPGSTRCYNIDGSGDRTGNLSHNSIPTIPGQQYTISWDMIWNISGASFQSSSYFGSAGAYYFIPFNQYARNVWTRCFYTFTAPGNYIDFIRFGFYTPTYSWLQVDNIKVEKGNKPTAYSLSIDDTQGAINTAQAAANAANSAYATLTANLKSLAYLDVVEAAKLGSTVITGGMLSNNLIDTNYIRTNVINAGYIESLEVVSKSIRTANPGTKRFEATQTTNSAILYDAANNALVEIDDDSAIERVRIDGTIEYGAGISVKSASNLKRSTLGSSGLNVYYNGDSRHTIGVAPLSDYGYVKLDCTGGFEINDGGGFRSGKSATVPYKNHAGENKYMLFVRGVMIDENFIP